jgi:holo-[acyl-carrier protein] synthase
LIKFVTLLTSKFLEIVEIGIDIIDINKIKDRMTREPDIAEQICTQKEIMMCKESKNFFYRLVQFFTIKEAVIKAIIDDDTQGFLWKDIEVTSLENGRAKIELKGRLYELAESKAEGKLLVSYSLAGDLALATVIFD